jgi:ribonucleoside-diphosphate reductase alpha chain
MVNQELKTDTFDADELYKINNGVGAYIELTDTIRPRFDSLIQNGYLNEFVYRVENFEKSYLSINEIANFISRDDPSTKEHTLAPLGSYDSVRHIKLDDAKALIKNKENSLKFNKLKNALDNESIQVYDFKGEKYLDRLDIGRIYHVGGENEGMSINRNFSIKGEDPFESVGDYQELELSIPGADFNMPDAYFPKSWENSTANNIVGNKYFFKPDKEEWREKLIEKIGKDHEYSPIHLINRVTNFVADEGERLGYFKTSEDKETFADELKWLQINRRFAFNSPVQFNAGLYNEYGVEGGNGINFNRDPETGVVTRIENADYKKPQCHACFIKGPRDDLESILKHAIDEGAIFSSGSGIGQDIGVLRSEGESLSCGGKASGPLSFFKIYDDCAGTIKSGGKSRRAARMTTMNHDHPDILKFVRGKVREDKKALDLMKAGYEPGMDGEAVNTVTYQNTNISVRAGDEFFDLVENDGKVKLKRVTDGGIVEEVSAKRMLEEIAYGSWRIGDPAIQYNTKIQEMHPCKNSGEQKSTNPCSEYLFLNDTSCNLLSHNLLEYSDNLGNFNIEEFKNAVKLTTIASDIINDAASYPVEDIARISPEFRTIGVGYANLGALLMRKGLAYDSDEGRALTSAITSLMTGTAYETSSDLAEKLEPFTHFEFNKKPFMEVMNKHKKNLDDVMWEHVPEDLKNASYESWENVVEKGDAHGFRNAQATVLAPTGTISFLMHADTTGIEPGISLKIMKSLAGGGSVELVNEEVPNALTNLGYNKSQINDISEYIKNNNKVVGSPHISPEHYEVFDTAFGDGKGNGTIPFEGHVKMLSAAQPFISGAISKTCNLPESATVKDIYDSYTLGKDLGLKALAVFRNNSKPTAALNLSERGFVELKRGEKEDLPLQRNAFENEINIGGKNFHIVVSEYPNGKPGQVTFLSYKAGSDLGALLTTSGVQASRALKRGVTLDDVAEGWIGHEFAPSGLVTGHPFIKMAQSPLDFAGKFLKLEYLGDLSVSTIPPEEVDITQLRGYQNGAFRTFNREKVDDWDFEQVIKDPEYGGFTDSLDLDNLIVQSNGKLSNNRGVTCAGCGNMMRQTSPNCFSCEKCGDKVGGCGL